MEKIWRFLGSVRLTLGVLLSLAGFAAAGTFPAGRRLLSDPYHHPAFVGMLLLLGLNVAFCTGQRLVARRRAAPGRALSCRSLSDAALHLSILVILCSGVFKGLGELVMTQNIHVGRSTETAYDWRAKTDAPLGFTLAVGDFVEDSYPVRARIGISRRDTGESLLVAEVREGVEAFLPGPGLYLKLTDFRQREGVARLEIRERESAPVRIAMSIREDEGRVVEYESYRLTMLAYKSLPRLVRSLITIREEGVVVREGWLEANGRMLHRGLRFSMTAWGQDPGGRPFVGIQLVRNPGEALFWVGCILLGIALPARLVCRRGPPGAGKPPFSPFVEGGEGGMSPSGE